MSETYSPATINHKGRTGRYTQTFINQNGPGDARPTALQIVKDEGREGTMKDKVFFLTGSSGGIGVETGRALAATGGRVFLGVRDVKKGAEACKDFLEPGRVELIEFDASSLESVRRAAKEFLQQSPTLNVLVNNAGIMACPLSRTVDGFESQLGINYVSHFLLYRLLEPALLAGSTADFHSRVVNVSSAGHHAGEVRLDDMNYEARPDEYEPWAAYGQSKTAMIYMTNEIERRFGEGTGKGMHGYSLMPGGIMTDLQRFVPEDQREGWDSEVVTKFLKSPAQGAATTMTAAVGREWEGKGGVYLEDNDVAGPMPEGAFITAGVKPYAFDKEKEAKLWAATLKMLDQSK